jgi:acetyl-CoA synthetase
MNWDEKDVWHPTAAVVENAQVTHLASRLGVDSFDALYEMSLRNPEAYWREVNRFCGVRWSRDYQQYCDVSRGTPFPSWFVGGELNWVDTILDNTEAAGRPAVIAEREGGSARRVTYSELRDEVRSVAAGLLSIGMKRGDRIGLLMENGIEATVSLLAISYIGAITVPLFSGFGADAITSRLYSCSARGLIATSGFQRRGSFVDVRATVDAVRAKLPELSIVVIKRSPEDTAPPHADASYIPWEDLRRPPAEAPPSARMSPNDPFMVIFTSGTTGKPKGAVHVHGGFPIKIAHDAAVHFDVDAEAVFCWPADIGWIAGALVLCSALLRGATLVCYDGAPDFPDWSRMANLVERYRVTHFGSSPTLIRGFASHEVSSTAADLSSLRLLITAGETIAPEHFIWFQRHFGRGTCPLINYTGGTEVSGALLSSVVVKPIVPAGFNGRSPGVAVEVVDSDGTPVTGVVGELAVLAPFVGMTAAFWQDEERYLDTYWRTVPGMWIHGDLAIKDQTGNFFLLGRSDDTIKVAGKRVGPAEVEEILVEIPGVREAAVIGATDPVKGQAIVAFIACDEGTEGMVGRTAVARVQERFGKPFAPRAVYVVPQLPKTRSLKIMRRVIRSIYSGSPAGDLSSLVNPESIGEIEHVIRKG